MTTSRQLTRLGTLIALAALAGLLAGCISDAGPQSTSSISNSQLRYYGGPKEQRWPGAD